MPWSSFFPLNVDFYLWLNFIDLLFSWIFFYCYISRIFINLKHSHWIKPNFFILDLLDFSFSKSFLIIFFFFFTLNTEIYSYFYSVCLFLSYMLHLRQIRKINKQITRNSKNAFAKKICLGIYFWKLKYRKDCE